MERFVFGPLTFEVHVLRRSKDRVRYGVKVFLGDEDPFMIQLPFDKGFPPRFIARKVLRDLKKIVDEPGRVWELIEEGRPELPESKAEGYRGLRQMWSWASERPNAILEAASAEHIS